MRNNKKGEICQINQIIFILRVVSPNLPQFPKPLLPLNERDPSSEIERQGLLLLQKTKPL